MTKIYTKKGDLGDTSLFDGTHVRKTEPRVAACGDVDELNATLGVALAGMPAAAADVARALEGVQRDLLALGALLADPRRAERPQAEDDRLTLGEPQVRRLEELIDAWEAELPRLRQFVLPGGHAAAAALHVARAVARRAERSVVIAADAGLAATSAVTYLNRLSDALFVAARVANHRTGLGDVTW